MTDPKTHHGKITVGQNLKAPLDYGFQGLDDCSAVGRCGDLDEQPSYKDTGCYRYHKGCSKKSLRGVISAELLSLREPCSPFTAHRLYTRR